MALEAITCKPISLDSTTKRSAGGMNKTLLITLLVVGALALLPVATAIVNTKAYKACWDSCAAFGRSREYNMCTGRCSQQFLNPDTCGVNTEAYNLCAYACAATLQGNNREYGMCMGRCQQQFLNSYC